MSFGVLVFGVVCNILLVRVCQFYSYRRSGRSLDAKALRFITQRTKSVKSSITEHLMMVVQERFRRYFSSMNGRSSEDATCQFWIS